MEQRPDRRQAVKIITVGGVAATLLLPTKWTKPVIESVVVPAHAQASPFGGFGKGFPGHGSTTRPPPNGTIGPTQ